jgi:aspartyl-tRNA(Asn)/glutamyl-tRNA(Gln) amidotransferase subunit A
MQGHDSEDPFCAQRLEGPVSGLLDTGLSGLRIAEAGGYFRKNLMPEATRAVPHICDALGVDHVIELPEAARARAAAYVITTSEGAALHLVRLRERAGDFDPDVRDRLIAGAMVPASMLIQAQKFRRWYQQAMLRVFDEVDAVIAPATPCAAPALGQKTMVLDGVELPVRANLGVFTQPISFAGLPVVSVPVAGSMPIGVQIIAAPWREDIALRIARHLEATGAAVAQRPAVVGQ